jgi:WD40 repeat protein
MVLTRGLAILACLVAAAKVEAVAPPPRLDGNGDPLPVGAVARLGAAQLRRQGFFAEVLLCPDRSVLLAPGLAQGGDARAVYYRWDLETGRRRSHLLPVPPGLLGSIDDWALFPDGKRLLHWDAERQRLSVIDLTRDRLLRRWTLPDEAVSCMAVAPGGRLAALGCREGRVEIHDLVRGGRVRTVPGRQDRTEALTFSADGRRLAIVNQRLPDPLLPAAGPSVRLVDVAGGKVHRELALEPCAALTLSPDARHVAATLKQGGVWLWELAGGRKRRLDVGKDESRCRLAFAPDGKLLLVTRPGRVKAVVFEVATGKRRREMVLRGLHGLDGTLRWTGDGQLLVGIENHTLLRTWSAETGRIWRTLPAPAAPPGQIVFSPAGRSLTVLAGAAAVHRWDVITGAQRFETHLDETGLDAGWTLTPDAERAVQVQKKTGRVVDVRTGKVLRHWDHDAPGHLSALSADGRVLALGEAEGVSLWGLHEGKKVRLLGKARPRWLLQFTPDGRRLAVGEADGSVALFDTASGKVAGRLQPRVKAPITVEGDPELEGWLNHPSPGLFSPDGRVLFTSHPWEGVRVWDVAAGRVVGAQHDEKEGLLVGGLGGPGDVRSLVVGGPLALSADGRLLARTLGSGKLGLWETASGRQVYQLDEVATAYAFAPAGWRLAAGRRDDHTVLIWDLRALFLASSPPPRHGRDLARLWRDLADSDAERAHRAAWALADTTGAAAFLARRLRPVEPVPPDRLKKWLADLGAEEFAARQKAELALRRAGEAARAGLERAWRSSTDLEVRLRVGRLLDRLRPASPARLREHRAVLALEVGGTAEARALLRRLAGGAKGAALTEEARAALARLEKGHPGER